jgi:uncharacterized phage protein (TIGR01671 family)
MLPGSSIEIEMRFPSDKPNKEIVKMKTLTPQNFFENPDLVLMQYTGLKDKNGKEIYEGDIYKSHSNLTGKCVVKFGYYYAGGRDYYASEAYGFYGEPIRDVDDTETLEGDMEIIGNIYENPELLDRG